MEDFKVESSTISTSFSDSLNVPGITVSAQGGHSSPADRPVSRSWSHSVTDRRYPFLSPALLSFLVLFFAPVECGKSNGVQKSAKQSRRKQSKVELLRITGQSIRKLTPSADNPAVSRCRKIKAQKGLIIRQTKTQC